MQGCSWGILEGFRFGWGIAFNLVIFYIVQALLTAMALSRGIEPIRPPKYAHDNLYVHVG